MTDRAARWDFPAELSAPERARHCTADALMAWGLDHLIPDSVLIVSELVTNAVVHAHAPTSVELRTDGQGVLIEVHDGGDGAPRMREWNHDGAGGLGLRIVDTTADGWQVIPDETGKTVSVRIGPGSATRSGSHDTSV